MKNKGFASMYLVYSFFLVFIVVMLSVLLVNNYKNHFLQIIKNDIKEEVNNHKLDKVVVEDAENPENTD